MASNVDVNVCELCGDGCEASRVEYAVDGHGLLSQQLLNEFEIKSTLLNPSGSLALCAVTPHWLFDGDRSTGFTLAQTPPLPFLQWHRHY